MKPKLPASFPANATLLNMDDPNFANQLAMVIGVEKGEQVEIITPQFTRTDGKKITYIPSCKEDFEKLPMLAPEILKDMGCQIWDKENGKTTWLFPYEWYNHIPDGLLVTDINGEVEAFKKGITDDDIRFGALSFGFVQEPNQEKEG